MKRVLVAVAVIISSMLLVSPASAEDEQLAPVEQVAPPAPEPEPEAAPAPVVEEKVNEPSAPAPDPKPVKKDKPATDTTTPEKPWICHPVNGKGETGTGWNLINPNHGSSHIDDEGNPKHESNDGRVDTPAVDGSCPGTPPEECTDECVPEKPEPVVKSKVKEKCVDAETVKVITVTKTWDWTLVDNVWVKNTEPTKDKTVDYRPAENGECDEPAPPFQTWTYGDPVCDGELYPTTIPEDDEFWVYYLDDKGDDSRTLVFTVEDRQTGEVVYTDEHTFPAPEDCDTDVPPTDEPPTTTAVDQELPNTGGLPLPVAGAAIACVGAGALLIRKARRA